MAELMPYIGFVVASFFAAGCATLAGFGSSTLLIPIAIMFMPLRQAVFLVACFHLFNNIFKVKAFHAHIDRRIALLFGIPSILMSFAGAILISTLPVEAVKVSIAVFLLGFVIYSWARPHFKFSNNTPNAIIGGASSGFLAGLIGMGGAIRGMFLVAFDLPKTVYIGTSAIIAFVIDCVRVPTYIITGAVGDSSGLLLIPFLIISAFLGVRVGKRYLERIEQATFKRIVLAALFIVAIKLLFS